jgi:thiol-disulfide isomerase/thioredoxin
MHRTQQFMLRVFTAIGFGLAIASPSPADDSQELTKALSFKPRQADVNYEKVSAEEVAKCKLERIARSDGKGFWLTGPAGQPLRWFVDTNGDKSPDRWCYYNNGVEVYRESDTDFNGTADEYRWLNTEGLRWGVDQDEDGVIESWRTISAEEVTAEVIAALANNDAQRFQRLLATDDELQSLGLGKAMIETVQDRVKTAREQFSEWMGRQKVVTSNSRWTNFGADRPGVVPAGTDQSTQDVIVYENAVALFEDAGQARQLIVGSMIQVNGAWRLASLPRLVGDQTSAEESGVFFPTSFSPRNTSGLADSAGSMSRTMESLVTELQAIDKELSEPNAVTAVLHGRRADVLEKLVSHSESAADRNVWIEQFADTVSAAAQVGDFPNGIDRINQFLGRLKDTDATPESMAYVAFRKITADHNLQMQQPNAKYDALNDAYLNSLREFIRQYPQAIDAAEAMLQIALAAEFTGDPQEAGKWYGQAASSFASTTSGKKAAGALRRLSLQGKPFAVSGPTLDERSFNSNAYRGGPVIYHCWASWCDSCKADMRALKELQAKYAKHKLRVVGLNLDNDRKLADAFVKQNPLPWINVFDPGGLESNLAIGYGILTLPVNIVVDKNGNVVKSGAHWTELDRIIEELVK